MAQNHQIKVSLMFDANTSQAKASLKDLQTSLNGFTNKIAVGEFPMTDKIKEAYVAAEKLKQALNASVNMQTGQFDISKFNFELKKAGLSAQSLGKAFSGAGSAGAQAFSQLATTIANAEIPTRRVSALVGNLAKSLKQTAQWQLSSSVIHGFTGALQQAYGYAQDLNRSLTDIRIVTGENLEFMERFAKEANKAAKELSTTTNEYAKASLIFYQQGLSDEDVAKRTAATMKMANVTGESAADISSYMTAIWNNFDNGTKSLEYYADAITALGAATASSTEEIAGGMQQFASVAETVGLSYEYAASALATVVSATRQSEETVGTSFKTIFARLSSLQLGEELEDGTTLTKYSAALAKVGIDIKDGNNQLKSMDKILDELGAKWHNISKEQQTALAYTVAGTRQYNNFIALLDNYEDFKINVALAVDAEGSLNEQQRIYAESWEAAADRVKAAAESIYEKLLDDDFFITMLNHLEKFITGLDKFIDSIGGLPGVLSLISTFMLRIFSAQAAEGLRNMTYTLKSFVGLTAKEAGKTKQDYMAEVVRGLQATKNDVGHDRAASLEIAALEKKVSLEQTYLQYQDKLNEKQRSEYNIQVSLLEILRQQAKEKQKQADKAKEKLDESAIDLFGSYEQVKGDQFKKKADAVANKGEAAQELDSANETYKNLENQIALKQAEIEKAEQDFQDKARAYINNTDLTRGHDGLGVGQREDGKYRLNGTVEQGEDGKYQLQLNENAKIKGRNQAATDLMQEHVTDVLVPAQVAIDKLIEELGQLKKDAQDQLDTIEIAEENDRMATELVEQTNPATRQQAKQALQRYQTYSTGENQVIKTEFTELLSVGKELKGLDPSSENYEQELAKFKENLKQFALDYEVELGEETNRVIQELLKEVEAGEIKDIKFDKAQTDFDEADEADTGKYGKFDKRDENGILVESATDQIRTAMEEEVGAKFGDQDWDKYAAGVKKATKAIKDGRKASDKYNDEIEDTSKTLKKQGDKILPDAYESFVQLSAGISGAVMAFNTLGSMWDTLKDPELSGWEKLTSVFMSLGAIIPIMAGATNSFGQALGFANAKQAISNGLASIGIVSKTTEIALSKAATDAERQKILMTSLGISTDQAALIVEKLRNGESLTSILLENSKVIAFLTSTGAKIAATGASWGLVSAEVAAQVAATPLLAITIALVAIIAAFAIALVALIGTIMLVVAAFKAIKDASPAEQLKKAQEEARAFATALDEAKERANELRDAFAEYNTIQDKLYECTRGTKAWNEALQENNDKVLELMEKYPQLVTMMNEAGERAITRENGILTIADWAQEEMLDASQRSVANMTAAYYSATANVRDKQYEVQKKEATTGAYSTLVNGTSVSTGAQVYEDGILKPMVDEYRQVFEDTRKKYGDDFTETEVLEILNSKKYSGAAFDYTDKTKEGIATILMDLNKESLELQKVLQANTEASKAQTEAYKNSLLGDNDTVQGSKYSEQIIAATSTEDDEQLDKRIQAEMDKMDKEAGLQGWGGQGINKATGVNDTARNIFQQYVKAAGLNDVTLIDTTGNDDNRVFVYTDGSGEPKKVPLDHMKRVVAASRAGTAVEAEAEELTKIYERVDSDKGAGAITAATAGNTSYLSRYQLAQGIDASEFNFTEEELNQMGFDTLKDFQDALNKSVELANAEFADAQKTFIGGETGIAADAINDIIEKGKSVEELQQLTDAQLLGYGQSINALYQNSGKETADSYVKAMDQIIANNADKAGQIMEIASGIDWTQGPEAAMSQLEGKLSEIDVAIDTTQESWIKFITTLEQNSKISVLAFNLDTIRTSLQKIKSLVEDIEIGSIVSDEDYKELLKYDGALHKFFQMTEDGYRYIGEQPLSEVINSVAEQQLAQGLEANARARAGAAKANEANYKYNKETVATDISNIDDSVFAALGEDKEALEELAAQANSDDPEVAKKAQEELMAFYDKIDTLRQSAAMGMYDDSKNYQVYASQYSTKSQLEAKREEFEKAGQMDAYNKQMEFLENQAKVLLEEYNKELDGLRLESLQEEFDELMEMSGKSSDAVNLLKQQSDIYAKSMADTKIEIAELGEQYGLTQQDGESLGEFMNRIAHEAPQEAAKILELSENIKTAGDNLKELDSMLADALIKHFEDTSQKYDKILTEYERNSSSISHYQNVLDLVNASEQNYEAMSQLAEAETKLATASLGESRKKYEELRRSRMEAEESLKVAIQNGDKVAQASWEKTLEELNEMEYDALEDMNDNWTEALEAAAAALETNTQRIMKAFETSMTGLYGSFDRMQEVFDQQSELNSQYVADYKKVYELSKLTRSITEQIDNAESVSAKQSLRELQEEVNVLQANGVKMSEYDLEYLQKKYDLRVAEIALEEAQNAKNQVRLQKTADGSWGYVYTANAEVVDEAQQNYEDALFELQDLSASYLEETSAAILSTQAAFNEAMSEIMSSGLSDEEKKKQMDETVAYYEERLNFLTSEFDNVIANNQGMANMVQNFSDSLLGAMYPSDEYSNATNIFEKWRGELGSIDSGEGVLGELGQELENYNNAVKDIFSVTGFESMEAYVQKMDEELNGKDGEGGLMGSLENAVNSMKEFSPENMQLTALDELLVQMVDYKTKFNKELNEMTTSYNNFINGVGAETDDDPKVLTPGGRAAIGLGAVYAARFDSGGYTGSWGSAGKMAILDEKELVLNKEDTANILSTVDIVRAIGNRIDLQASAAQYQSALSQLRSVQSAGDNKLSQEVTIHAEFPNATNHSEIEQAFDTLINRAAQYTNQYR